jgi:hypothetical protein
VFGGDVQVERRPSTHFVAGDFNGDDSQDLLVAVKPVKERLSDINSNVANWIIQDPRHHVPPKNKRVVVPPPAAKPEKVRPGETLLAVIHGYGPTGWRDPMALQAYLLRGAAGTSLQVSQPSKKLIHDFGAFPSARDVVSEKLRGSTGVLYWTKKTAEGTVTGQRPIYRRPRWQTHRRRQPTCRFRNWSVLSLNSSTFS